MFGAPASHGRRDAQPHTALGGELERIRQQILQHLLQALGVGDDTASEARIDLDVERQLPVFRLVPERAPHRIEEIGCENLLRIHGDGSRLDLGKIKDVADQVEQVGARAVNGSRKFDLLGRQIAVGIFGKLLAKYQYAVERRPEFVRHVGKEFGLVLRGQRKFGRFLFERAPRLFDFLIFALHLVVAFGMVLSLLLELLVGLLQLLLLCLQLSGELLGLLQQPFGLHGGFDAVEHDADAVGELLEEGHLRSRE